MQENQMADSSALAGQASTVREVPTRTLRQVSEREIAIALVIEFAEGEWGQFSLYGFYDNDADFLNNLAARLNVPMDKAFKSKLARVVRRLVNYGVLYARTSSTHKEYFGEPTHQRNYWMNPGKASLIRRGETEHTGSPEWEAEFLLRRAYPRPDLSEKGAQISDDAALKERQ